MTTNIANSSGYAVLSNKNTIGNVDPIGTNYTIKLNGQEITVKLIVSVSEDSGYQGYLYENLSNRELYVVHEGSIDPLMEMQMKLKKIGQSPIQGCLLLQTFLRNLMIQKNF